MSGKTESALYLITGGAGFIGSNLAEALVRDGQGVRIFDDFSSGSLANLAAIRDQIDVVEGDLRDYAAVQRAMQGVTYVAHQGALRSVERSVDDPLSSDAVNTHGTLHVLMAARDTPGVKRMVYASSSSVYGENPTLPRSRPGHRRRCRRTRCRSRGGVTIAASSASCMASRPSACATTQFRAQTEPAVEAPAVIPPFMLRRSRPALEVPGDGEQSRDFRIYDNVAGDRLALTNLASAARCSTSRATPPPLPT